MLIWGDTTSISSGIHYFTPEEPKEEQNVELYEYIVVYYGFYEDSPEEYYGLEGTTVLVRPFV